MNNFFQNDYLNHGSDDNSLNNDYGSSDESIKNGNLQPMDAMSLNKKIKKRKLRKLKQKDVNSYVDFEEDEEEENGNNLKYVKEGAQYGYLDSIQMKKYLSNEQEINLMYSSCDELSDEEIEEYDYGNNYDDDNDSLFGDGNDIFNSFQENKEKNVQSLGKKRKNLDELQLDNKKQKINETNVWETYSTSEDELLKNSKSFPKSDERDELEDIFGKKISSPVNNQSIINLEDTNDIYRKQQFKKLKKLHFKRRNAEFCFGCTWQDPNKVTVHDDAVSNMMLTIYKLYGQIRNEELARIIHIQFKRDIYEPLKEEGMKIPIWRTYQILDHIKYHNKDPRFFISNEIEELIETKRILQNMSFIYKKNDETEKLQQNDLPYFDKDAIKLRLDVGNRIMQLYKMDPKSMNFYNDKLPINLNQAGAIINLHKKYTRRI